MITKHATSRTLLVRTPNLLDPLRVEHSRHQIKSFMAEGYCNLIFDMMETTYINSSGLGWLVEAFQTVRKQNGTFKVLNTNEQIRTLLRQSHLEQLLIDGTDSGVTPPEQLAGGDEAQFDRLHELMSAEIYLLTQINQIVARVLKLDEPRGIAVEVLRGAREMTQAGFGCIFFLDDSRHHLVLVDQDGSTPSPEQNTQFLIRSGSLEHQLLFEEEVFCVALSELENTQAQTFRKLGFSNLMAAPIRGREQCLGLLALEETEATRELLLAAKPLLSAFTQICGQALENTALAARLKERNHELKMALDQLRESHQTLANAGRLAAMGTVVSGLGHQLNNKLMPMMGYCQLLAKHEELPEDVLGRIDVIQSAGMEMQQVIKKLMHLSTIHERAGQPLDAHECLRVALGLLCGPIETNQILLEMKLADAAPRLVGDSDLLLQALLGILHRACTSFSDQPERRVAICTAQTGRLFHIQIEDNGAVLNGEDLQERPDPLVSLEGMGNGQIFSYAIPRGLIRRLGGMMNISNREQGGKIVIIDLPVE